MGRRTLFAILAGVVGAVVLGFFGIFFFTLYGGNSCDVSPAMTCDCFCCHMFNTRGYESCGVFGLWLGIIIGAVAGVLALLFVWRRSVGKKKVIPTANMNKSRARPKQRRT